VGGVGFVHTTTVRLPSRIKRLFSKAGFGLSVKGLPFATSNFSATPNAREPQPFENVSISVSGIDVVVSAGSARTQFSFEEDTINVISEGYGFELLIEPLGKRVLVQRKDEDEKFLRVD